MQHWRRGFLIAWFAISFLVAVNSAAGMFIDFAPRHAKSLDASHAESESIERVRRLWMSGVFATSGLLVVSSGAVVVLGWRRVA